MAVGYGISSVFSVKNISWKYGFYIQGFLMIAIAVMFSIIPADIYQHKDDSMVELEEEREPKL